ncbi:DnaJ-like protein subfamily C member 11 [Trichoplax sp. H2]|nr:DnaJ-like protein subfamily C member 11 [Trichoplax sp. H2]|eukprot:RDD39395.1 DnaJ-like protein subfamily C member 11 [Trichoplax sp. H2]
MAEDFQEKIDPNSDHSEYYAILNVRRDASPEELRTAYRRMCVVYHPDKHPDPTKKQIAEELFAKLHNAYSVLSDPNKRQIYDIYGEAGLEAGWEVVSRKRTPAEIYADFERLKETRDKQKLEERTNPKGTFSIGIDATDLFNRYDDGYDGIEREMPNIEVREMEISQAIDFPVTVNNTVTLSGALASRNGIGGGNALLTFRNRIATGWHEVEVGAGNGILFNVGGCRYIGKHSHSVVKLNSQITNGYLRPGLTAMFVQQLDSHTIGYLTWRAGIQSSINTTVVHDDGTNQVVVGLQVGFADTFLMARYVRRFQSESRLFAEARYGLLSMALIYGAETKVTKHSLLSAAVSVSVPRGITLKLKVTRGTQTYKLPIYLSEEVDRTIVFYATVVPLLTYWTVQSLIIKPFIARMKREEDKYNAETRAETRRKAKREAESAIKLMEESYNRSVDSERSKGGLIIVRAWFGKLLSSSREDINKIIDVTIPLQCQVKDSRLIIPEGEKNEILGFYDPCPGEEKMLRIEYEFRLISHEVTINEKEALRVPKQSHRIQGQE